MTRGRARSHLFLRHAFIARDLSFAGVARDEGEFLDVFILSTATQTTRRFVSKLQHPESNRFMQSVDYCRIIGSI